MTLNVLRSTNSEGKDEMMKLVRYSTDAFEDTIGVEEGGEGWKDGNIEEEAVQPASYSIPSMVVEEDEIAEDDDLL